MTFAKRTHNKRLGWPIGKIAAVVLFIAAAQPAYAGKISVDFGENQNTRQNFSTDVSAEACAGAGPASCELSLVSNSTSNLINIGFNINFGSGSIGQLTVDEDGVVRIGSGLINVFSTGLVSAAASGNVFDTLSNTSSGLPGEIMYSRGFADPEADGSGIYDFAQAVGAFHVSWAGVLEGTSARFLQMLLYNQGNGDFDLRLRYGLNSVDTYALTSAVAGFNLGSNSVNLVGPLVTTTDYFYRFRGGSLISNTSVPEPGTLVLLALGLLGIAWSGRCRVS